MHVHRYSPTGLPAIVTTNKLSSTELKTNSSRYVDHLEDYSSLPPAFHLRRLPPPTPKLPPHRFPMASPLLPSSNVAGWPPSHCHGLLPIPSITTNSTNSTISFLLLLLLHNHVATVVSGIRVDVIRKPSVPSVPAFREAPAFRNGDECSAPGSKGGAGVDVAITLDANYLRGTMAAVLSVLQHTSCPENVAFHFLVARFEPEILSGIRFTFPYLDFRLYRFDSNRVRGKISRSIRHALDQPLNYARIYLADILPPEVTRIIYLDSDVILVDDVRQLWEVDLEGKVVAAPEYCHVNFTKYFTESFWSDQALALTFEERRPCYFNTGVMVIDVEKWRQKGYTKRVEDWMGVQKQKRIYHRRWTTGGTSTGWAGTIWRDGAGASTRGPSASSTGVARVSRG